MFKTKISKSMNHPALGSILFFAALNSVGCNNKTQPVNPVHVLNSAVTTSFAPNQDEWIDFSITLSTQNFVVAALTLPILNPQNPSIQYGSLSLQPVFCTTPANCPYGNGAQIGVNLNLTSITSAKGIAPLLPNGAALPVGGLQNAAVIALPVANTGAVVYFAFGKGVAMLGTAVPFTQLNTVGQTIPGANLFIPATITTPKGNFTLLPGIFTGQAPNTTGIGFFADLAGIIPQSTVLASLTRAKQTAQLSSKAQAPSIKSNLIFPSTVPSTQKRNRLYQELINLNQRGGYLNLQ